MSHTKHINRKINKTDLRANLITWLCNERPKTKTQLIETLEMLCRQLHEIEEKGGYTLVSCDGTDITIYQNR